MNERTALTFAQFVSEFVHLEQKMCVVLAVLIGHEKLHDSRFILNSIISPKARIGLLRNVLQKAPRNTDRSQGWDDCIDVFDHLNSRRNDYAHGQWFTNSETSDLELARTKDDPHRLGFVAAQPFDSGEMRDGLKRIRTLTRQLDRLWAEHGGSKQPKERPQPITGTEGGPATQTHNAPEQHPPRPEASQA